MTFVFCIISSSSPLSLVAMMWKMWNPAGIFTNAGKMRSVYSVPVLALTFDPQRLLTPESIVNHFWVNQIRLLGDLCVHAEFVVQTSEICQRDRDLENRTKYVEMTHLQILKSKKKKKKRLFLPFCFGFDNFTIREVNICTTLHLWIVHLDLIL